MGSASSVCIYYPSVLKPSSPRIENPSRPLPTSVRSSRISYHSASTRTAHSVRQIALINHSRQENSYISASQLAIDLRQTCNRKSNHSNHSSVPDDSSIRSHVTIPASLPPSTRHVSKNNSVRKPESTSPVLSTTTEVETASGSPYLEGPQLVTPVDTSGDLIIEKEAPMNFNEFRSRIALKIVFDDPNETEASPNFSVDDEDLATYGPTLIGIDNSLLAKTSSNSTSNSTSNSKNASRTNSVYMPNDDLSVDSEGTLSITELGERIDFGSDGIRKNKSAKAGKLQMRERLIILCKLGSGASSIVYKAFDLVDMRLVALKIIKVDDKVKRMQMIRELTSLYQILKQNSIRRSGHLPPSKRPDRFIVDFYDAFCNLEDGTVCLMMEYMDGGSLQDIADQGGCANEVTLANIAVQSLKGIKFLHDSCQIHRDLKPANFLISHKGEVKVADLGLLKQLPQKSSKDEPSLQKTSSFVGTAAYMSPERIDGKSYSYAADVWGFGLSLMCLALGRFPIKAVGGYWNILSSIRDTKVPSLPKDKFSPEIISFLNGCLERKPEDRLTVQELLAHPFISKAEPEDLRYDLDIERGCDELYSILDALVLHISSLKSEIILKYRSYDEYLSNTTSTFEKLFGNMWTDSVYDIIKKLIFNDKENAFKPFQSGRSVSIKGKLFLLARQLHLPYEKVLLESRNYLHLKEFQTPLKE